MVSAAPAGRNQALDGLRALAVSAVVYRHLGLPGLYGGGVGVFAFFTLSGFIITFLLCAELARADRVRLGAFWARRARRLIPALLLTVVLSVALAAWSGVSAGTTFRQALPAVGYVSNWYRVWASYHPTTLALGPFDHTWSLSIEEQFYLSWPLVFLLLWKVFSRNLSRLVLATVVLAETSAAVRWLSWDSAHPARSANVLYNRTDAEAELLLLGAAAGVLAWQLLHHPQAQARWERLLRWALPAAAGLGLLVLGAAFRLQPTQQFPRRMHLFWTGGLTLITLGVAAICLHTMVNDRSRMARALGIYPLPQLGRISYGIYLYHYPCVVYLLPRFAHHRVWADALVVVSTLTLSIVSWHVVERPIMKRRWRRAEPPGRTR